MKVLLLDAYNLIHRARTGFMSGEYPIVFNFFRSVRPIIEKFDPDLVYFVLEGRPEFRQELSGGNYKSNRVSLDDSFHRQKATIINAIKSYFPFVTIRHPKFECDDVIASLAAYHARKDDKVTVVSSDSDFIQLLNHFDITLYHPIKKKNIEVPDYDYVTWKALRGDATDNIAGIRGCGDKTAHKLVKDSDLMREYLSVDDRNTIFERNVNLIRLVDLTSAFSEMEIHQPVGNMTAVKMMFDDMGFVSVVKEKTWQKYEKTFENLVNLTPLLDKFAA